MKNIDLQPCEWPASKEQFGGWRWPCDWANAKKQHFAIVFDGVHPLRRPTPNQLLIVLVLSATIGCLSGTGEVIFCERPVVRRMRDADAFWVRTSKANSPCYSLVNDLPSTAVTWRRESGLVRVSGSVSCQEWSTPVLKSDSSSRPSPMECRVGFGPARFCESHSCALRPEHLSTKTC